MILSFALSSPKCPLWGLNVLASICVKNELVCGIVWKGQYVVTLCFNLAKESLHPTKLLPSFSKPFDGFVMTAKSLINHLYYEPKPKKYVILSTVVAPGGYSVSL